MRALAILALAACALRGTAGPPAPAPAAGISIALYDRGGDVAYSVVDDRRWVEVTGHVLALDHIDPGAALASLVIEPLTDRERLQIGTCARQRVEDLASRGRDELAKTLRAGMLPPTAAPPRQHADSTAAPARDDASRMSAAVRCELAGAPGRYLVRILYVTAALRYRAEHAIQLTAADRARVTTRFAITTPAWRERADVTLFDGVPGGEAPPREVARDTVTLDGAIAVIEVPARETVAQLRRIYDGAIIAHDVAPTDPMWGRESTRAVWVWLLLPKLTLAPGPLHVHVDLPGEGVRDLDLAGAGHEPAGDDADLALPLWADESLRGTRQRFNEYNEGAALAERLLLSVANLGDTPREVWIEEHVRPARHRRIERAWPTKPIATGDVLRTKLEVSPGKIERVGYTVTTDF